VSFLCELGVEVDIFSIKEENEANPVAIRYCLKPWACTCTVSP